MLISALCRSSLLMWTFRTQSHFNIEEMENTWWARINESLIDIAGSFEQDHDPDAHPTWHTHTHTHLSLVLRLMTETARLSTFLWTITGSRLSLLRNARITLLKIITQHAVQLFTARRVASSDTANLLWRCVSTWVPFTARCIAFSL